MSIRVDLPDGGEFRLEGENILVSLSHGCLIVTILIDNHRHEYCWPPGQWEGYEMGYNE